MSYRHDQYPREAVVRFVKGYKAAHPEYVYNLYMFLDIGSGGGRHSELALSEGFQVVQPIDIDSGQADEWCTIKHDIREKPYGARAECIVVDGVLDHLLYSEFHGALDNVFASVAPGGWLFISLAESCPREYVDMRTFHAGCHEAEYVKGPEPGVNQIFFNRSGIIDVTARAVAAGLTPTYAELLSRMFGDPVFLAPEEWGRWFLWFERGAD